MRVTSNTFPDSLVDQLARLAVRQNRLQNQAATGQRIQVASDDPVAMQRVLGLQNQAKSVAQYKKNIGNLQEVAQASYEAMRGLQKVLDRAGELAIQADSTRPATDLKVFATEVTQLIKQAVQSANAKYRGDYLFSGTQSDQTPFAIATDAEGNVTSVTYQGNQDVREAEIAEGTTMSVGVVGGNGTGTGPRGVLSDSRSGADFFNHLIELQNQLLAGDTQGIAATTRDALSRDEDNLLLHIGENGVKQSRLEAAAASATKQATTVEELVSNEVDADLAQTLVRLSQTQNAYQAAMQSGANLLSTSLLDYIR
jgi:flagellar hook-associated protein 3 FlgL